MAAPPKLGDVAKAANLSAASVSRYLNGSLRLPPETARRIDTAVQSLGYRPHPHARSLSRGKTDTIGLLLPEIANPFFSQLAAAIEAAADARGLGVMLCSSLNRPEREVDYLARLRRNVVDGLLFATNHPDDGRLAQAVNEAPGVVLIDEDIEGTRVPKVFSDNHQGGRLAAEHFLGFGHAHLAYIGGPRNLMSPRERGEGFARTLREGGGGLVADYLGPYARQHGEAAARDLFDRHPEVTGVFVGSDEILMGLLSVMRERGLAVGTDLSVVTFDDAGPLDMFAPPSRRSASPSPPSGRWRWRGCSRRAGRRAPGSSASPSTSCRAPPWWPRRSEPRGAAAPPKDERCANRYCWSARAGSVRRPTTRASTSSAASPSTSAPSPWWRR